MDLLPLVNRALLKCGLPLAASLEDYDWNARLVFEESALQALRSFNWSFATRRVRLSGAACANPPWSHVFALPADCLRVSGVYGRCGPIPHAREGNAIYANAPECELRHVARTLDMAGWPPDFSEAVACLMAAEIATLGAETMALAPNLLQIYQARLAAAQDADASENVGRVPVIRDLWLARADPCARVSGWRGFF